MRAPEPDPPLPDYLEFGSTPQAACPATWRLLGPARPNRDHRHRTHRLHSRLGYVSPAEFDKAHYAALNPHRGGKKPGALQRLESRRQCAWGSAQRMKRHPRRTVPIPDATIDAGVESRAVDSEPAPPKFLIIFALKTATRFRQAIKPAPAITSTHPRTTCQTLISPTTLALA